MASGGETPKTDGHAEMGEKRSRRKGPNPKHTRSGQLGWLTQCYGKVLAAVGKPDNRVRVAELLTELQDLWQKYEKAHSEYLASACLSGSKFDELEKQHEEHRGDYYRATETMRRYLTTGLSPRRSPSRTHDERSFVTEEELERARRDSLEAKRRREYHDTQRKFLQQNEELAQMRLSLLESRSGKSDRSRAVDYLREPTGSPRRMSCLVISPPRSPQQPPVQRSLETEMQAAAASSSRNTV